MNKHKRHAKESRKKAALHLIGQAERIALFDVGAGQMANWQGISRPYAWEILQELVRDGLAKGNNYIYRHRTKSAPEITARYYTLTLRAKELYEDDMFKAAYKEVCIGELS